MYLAGKYCYRINAVAPRPTKTVHKSQFGRLSGQNGFKSVDLQPITRMDIGLYPRFLTGLVPSLGTIIKSPAFAGLFGNGV